MVRMTPVGEVCARCGRAINSRQTPSVWRDNVVCKACHSKLRAIEPAMALRPSAMPVLKYAPKPPRVISPYAPRILLGRAVSLVSSTITRAR